MNTEWRLVLLHRCLDIIVFTITASISIWSKTFKSSNRHKAIHQTPPQSLIYLHQGTILYIPAYTIYTSTKQCRLCCFVSTYYKLGTSHDRPYWETPLCEISAPWDHAKQDIHFVWCSVMCCTLYNVHCILYCNLKNVHRLYIWCNKFCADISR